MIIRRVPVETTLDACDMYSMGPGYLGIERRRDGWVLWVHRDGLRVLYAQLRGSRESYLSQYGWAATGRILKKASWLLGYWPYRRGVLGGNTASNGMAVVG